MSLPIDPTAIAEPSPEGRRAGPGGGAEGMSRRFWLGFFLPVNTLFHGLAWWLPGVELTLEAAAWPILIVKTVFFALFTYGVLALLAVWRAGAGGAAQRQRRVFLALGVISLAVFLAVHGERLYQFGRLEREIVREAAKVNAAGLPGLPPEVRFNGIWLAGRGWFSEYGLAKVSITQLDPAKFKAAARTQLIPAICADPWLKRLLAAKFEVHVAYRDREGKPVMDETLRHADCADGN